MLPFSMRMFLSPGSKVKTVFAPMRVMVLSGAVTSTREAGPVDTRSGTRKISFVTAGFTALSAAATTFASWMISVNVLSVSEVAANVRTPVQQKIPASRNNFFMWL
jgi:hypothetical protein